jgi:hypothetical protein
VPESKEQSRGILEKVGPVLLCLDLPDKVRGESEIHPSLYKLLIHLAHEPNLS